MENGLFYNEGSMLQKLFNVRDVNDAMFVSFLNVRIVVEINCSMYVTSKMELSCVVPQNQCM